MTVYLFWPNRLFCLEIVERNADLELSMTRNDISGTDTDAIQMILQDLMRHIMQLQSKRCADTPVRDEPVKMETSLEQRTRTRIPSYSDRHRQIVRQLRDTEENATGLREQLHASLSAVASNLSLGPQTLHRESTKLDGLVSGAYANTKSIHDSVMAKDQTDV